MNIDNNNEPSSTATTNIDSDVQHLLLPREQVLLRVTQSSIEPASSMTTPSSLYITNMRVIYRLPKWGGLKADIIDLKYQEITDIALKSGMLHTDIVLKSPFHTEQDIIISGVDKQEAEQADALIRQGIRGGGRECFAQSEPHGIQESHKDKNH